MINNINKNKLRNNKFKLFVTSMILVASLSGCAILPSTDNNIDTVTTTREAQEQSYYPITIYYESVDKDIYDNEMISFIHDGNIVYNIIGPSEKGYTNTNVITDNGEIYSTYLNKSVTVPNIDNNHRIELTIDYKTKTMDVQVVSLEKQK